MAPSPAQKSLPTLNVAKGGKNLITFLKSQEMKLCLLKFLFRMNVPLWPAECVLRFWMRLLWIPEFIDNAFLRPASCWRETEAADLVAISSPAPTALPCGVPHTLCNSQQSHSRITALSAPFLTAAATSNANQLGRHNSSGRAPALGQQWSPTPWSPKFLPLNLTPAWKSGEGKIRRKENPI